MGESPSSALFYDRIFGAVPVWEVCMKLMVCMKMMIDSEADDMHEPACLYYLNGVCDLIGDFACQ